MGSPEKEHHRRKRGHEHTPRAAPGARRLELLYDIGQQLTRSKQPEVLIPDVLSTMARALALRSAVLAMRIDGAMQLVAWPTNGSDVSASVEHARALFAYLLQEPELASTGVEVIRGRLPRAPPEGVGSAEQGNRFLVLPLAVEHRPPFGALQLESWTPLHEVDLSFVDTIVTQLAVALDRRVASERAAAVERRGAAAEAGISAARGREAKARAEADVARAVTRSLSEGVISVGGDGAVTMMNPAAERLLHWTEGEALGRELDEVAPLRGLDGAVLPAERRLARRVLRTGDEERDEECFLVDRSGLAFPVRYTASAIREGGHVVGAVVVFDNLSSLRVAEREQRTLAELGTALVATLEPADVMRAVCRTLVPAFADVCFIDRLFEDGHVERGEIAVADRLDPSSAEELRRWKPAPDREAPPERAIRTGKPVLVADPHAMARGVRDARHAALLGETGLASMIALPLVARGRPLGALCCGLAGPRRYGLADVALATDVAQRVALALDNTVLYGQAQAAIRARERTLAVVSHDLRNPLGAILTGAALLVRSAEAEDWRERCLAVATRIQRTAGRMNALVEQLLDFSRIQAGRLTLDLQDRAAEALVAEAAASVEAEARGKTVALTTAIEAPVRLVRCDFDRMLQVLANLLGNAIKFTPSGGSVTLRVEAAPDAVRFSVADTGPGIPEEQRAHVFDAFWQAKPGGRAGVGLGLAIVKGIVDAHRGTIDVQSKPGAGTTFTVTLPAP